MDNALNTQLTELDEGIKAPNLRGGHLKLIFTSQEELLDCDKGGGNPSDPVPGAGEPCPEEFVYLSNLTSFQ
jgi:hypothetical protein